MHWNERMKTEIKLGNTYETRNGYKVKVVAKLNDNNFEVNRIIRSEIRWGHLEEYIVNKFGGFGNYPNHYDLIRRILI